MTKGETRMKKLCILADTHGLLRDEVKAELAQADGILHAGDIDTDAVLQYLEQCGPLYAVAGNADKRLTKALPRTLSVRIEGVRFFLVHNKKDIPASLTDTDVVVVGHSHKYAAEMSGGMLYLNPGGCGRRRFDLELSFCRMTVSGKSYRYEKILLPKTL